jgi:dGTPase
MRDREARFCRDRDRLITSPAFRRLAGKTQVVAMPSDPLIRTRLTHTLEVTSIAREMGRGIGALDPLVEAIALGHDIGHPAFGHAGERALAALVPGGFHHASHGVRIVTELEPGLDLAPETVEGILKHSKGRAGTVFGRGGGLASLGTEALVVRAADLYAYACHDLDDAYLLGDLHPRDLPARPRRVLGTDPAGVRRVLVDRTIASSSAHGKVSLDAETEAALQELRAFLYARLYEGPRIARQTAVVGSLLGGLWEAACERPLRFDATIERLGVPAKRKEMATASDRVESFVDAVAAMTDRQVLDVCRALRLPRKAWSLPKAEPDIFRESIP